MGFDLSITLSLRINLQTGLPFVWGKDYSHQPYTPSDFEVPEKYRKWVNRGGHVFHFYIKNIDEFSTSVASFLENYPEWNNVLKDMGPNGDYDYWTLADHDEFKEALEWFNTKTNFEISWSY
jgi:hypothetical protein